MREPVGEAGTRMTASNLEHCLVSPMLSWLAQLEVVAVSDESSGRHHTRGAFLRLRDNDMQAFVGGRFTGCKFTVFGMLVSLTTIFVVFYWGSLTASGSCFLG